MRIHHALGAFVLLLAPRAAGAEPGTSPSTRLGWEYTVRADPGLKSLKVRLCFPGTPPARVVLDGEAGFKALRLPAGFPRDGNGGLAPQGIAAGGCLEYEVDLGAIAGDGREDAYRVGDDLVTKPTRWLLRPLERAPGT